MIKTIFQTAVGSFLGVVLGALLGALWLVRQLKSSFEEKIPTSQMRKERYKNHFSPKIRFDTGIEAMEVLESLKDSLSEYGFVTVYELNDLIHHEPGLNDENWGWTDLVTAYIQSNGKEVFLVLPRPKHLV